MRYLGTVRHRLAAATPSGPRPLGEGHPPGALVLFSAHRKEMAESGNLVHKHLGRVAIAGALPRLARWGWSSHTCSEADHESR